MIGTVKWYNPMKGYGFIMPEDGSKDVFVHKTSIEKAGLRIINEGQKLNFEIATNKGKSSAVNLKIIS